MCVRVRCYVNIVCFAVTVTHLAMTSQGKKNTVSHPDKVISVSLTMLSFLPTFSFCGDMIGTHKCIVYMRDMPDIII